MIAQMEDVFLQTGVDKRYLPRWSTQIRGLCRIEKEGKSVSAPVLNLSCGGACLVLNKPVHIIQKIDLAISFPLGSGVTATGSVRWVKKVDKQYYVGIHFINVSSAVQDAILKNMLNGVKRTEVAHFWFRGWNNE